MNLKMKNVLKLIILIVVILIICIISICILKIKVKNEEERSATPATHIEAEQDSKVLERVSNNVDYYIVKNCTKNFYINYSQIYNIDSGDLILDDTNANNDVKEQNIKNIYNMLDDSYIKENNITLENLENKLSKINNVTVDIIDSYVCTKSDNIKVYFVYGNLMDVSKSSASKFSLILKVDVRNRTFKVILNDYIKKYYNNIEIGKEVDIDIPDEIENNGYNVYQYQNIADEEYLNDIFTSCKLELLYSTEDLYNKFEDEYKEKRFSDLKELNDFVKNNKKIITMMKLAKYQKNVYDDYTEYICIDNNNRYYVIKEKSMFEYTITLDTYTINTQEFKKKYDEADNITKVGYNLEKIKNAINDKNYKYVYDKLNSQFRQNNYNNYNIFSEYLKNNLFDNNEFNYENIENKQSVYVANININDATKKDDISKNASFVMKLNDNYEFEISFSIDN